jgi:hypothetical protein
MKYTVEIVGLVPIEASTEEMAIRKVKEMFENEQLTYEDLYFSADN